MALLYFCMSIVFLRGGRFGGLLSCILGYSGVILEYVGKKAKKP